MDVKALAHGLTPPLIWNAARRILRGAHAQPLVEEPFKPFEGDYASFDDALAAAGNTDADNYQKEPEISYVVSSTAAIRNSREMNLAAAFRVLALIEYIQLRSSARRVVDFGGALGHYYFRLRPHLSGPLSWQVVELPAMIEAAADFGNDELTFHGSLSEIEHGPDIVLASGSIQYQRDPYACIAELQDLSSAWLIIDRMALVDTPRDRLTVQDTTGVYDARFPRGSFPARESMPRWLAGSFSLTGYLTSTGTLTASRFRTGGTSSVEKPDRPSCAAPGQPRLSGFPSARCRGRLSRQKLKARPERFRLGAGPLYRGVRT